MKESNTSNGNREEEKRSGNRLYGFSNWLLTFLMLGVIGFLLWYLLGTHDYLNFCGCDCNCVEYIVVPKKRITPPPPPKPTQDTIYDDDDVPEPTKNCGVHFSGVILSDYNKVNCCNKIFTDDPYGEYVGSGYYPDNTKTFPKAVKTTFDAIAVDRGTHLIIYSERDFKGDVLLDVTGPMLITNVYYQKSYAKDVEKTFSPDLEALFPPSRRQWSSSNMHDWSYGSCKIICEQ